MEKTIKTYIGIRYKAKDTAEGVLKTLEKNPAAETIELYARGKAISIAIDVLEILKRRLNINKSHIKANTAEAVNDRGHTIKTSEIAISLPCQKPTK